MNSKVVPLGSTTACLSEENPSLGPSCWALAPRANSRTSAQVPIISLFSILPILGYFLEHQHFSYFVGSPFIKSGLMGIFPGIFKGTEQHIEEGEIGIIVGMDASGMVQGMRFRPLYDIPEPDGGLDIAVLEDGQKGGAQDNHGSCLGTEPCHQYQTETNQKTKPQHIHQTKIKGSEAVHTLHAVVHLVEHPPKQVAVVHSPVPEVEPELVKQDSQ